MKKTRNLLTIIAGSLACMVAIIMLTANYTEYDTVTSITIAITGIGLMVIGANLLTRSSLFREYYDIQNEYDKLLAKYNKLVDSYIAEMSENSVLICNTLEKDIVIHSLEKKINDLEKEIEALIFIS